MMIVEEIIYSSYAKGHHMWGLYRRNMKLLKTNFEALVWFEVLYKLMAAVALYPLLLFLLDFAIDQAGLVYLTNSNLKDFFTKPLSIGIVFIILIVIVIYSLFELVVLSICYEMSRNGEKTDVVTLFYIGVTRLWKILRPESIALFFLVLLAAAIFNLPFASSLVSMTVLTDYLRSFLGDHHEYYIIAAAAAAIIIYLISFLLFSIHYLIIENRKFVDAGKASRNLAKGESIRNALRFLVWFLLVFLVIAAVYAAVIIVAAYIVKFIWAPEAQAAAFLSGARIINQITTLLSYAIFTPLVFLMVSSLFYTLKEHRSEPHISVIKHSSGTKIKKWMDILLVLVIIISFFLNFNTINLSLQSGILRNVELVRTPAITAHRGSSAIAPENTLSAIRIAAEEMADYAEIDVRATKDGVVVLLHDENLKRTTGVDKNIWEVSYEETQRLDVGSWLSDQYVNERIPTLDEIIKYADGKIMLNIEIKTSENSPDLVASVVKIIGDNHFEDQCVVSTFNYGILNRIKELNPDIRTGVIITVAYARYTRLSSVDFYSLDAQFISRDKVEKLHILGYEVFAWGVNDAATARRVMSIGVDNIITSDPLLAKEIVYTASANFFVLKVAEWVFGDTDLKPKSVRNIFLPYW